MSHQIKEAAGVAVPQIAAAGFGAYRVANDVGDTSRADHLLYDRHSLPAMLSTS